MDQVRKALAWLKQYHFWVLSVLVVLIGVGCWWSASGALRKKYEENHSKITGVFSSLQTVSSDTFHPNQGVQDKQTEELNALREEVLKLWDQLYEAQREQVLIWPSGPTELKPEFIKTVEKLRFGDDIPDDQGLREHYQNYIENHFPKLPEKIGARPIEEGTTGISGGGLMSRRSYAGEGGISSMAGGQMEDDGNFICEWAPEDQSIIRDELRFPQTPSALRIWCTQENLWVYHALLDVIKNTNTAANATRVSNAAVRGIYSLEVGQRAAPYSRTKDRIFKMATATPMVDPSMVDPSLAPTEGGAPPSEFGGAEFRGGLAEGITSEMSPEQERAALLSGRYLGEDGKPIMIAGPAAAMEGEPVPVDPNAPVPPLDVTQFGKEFKRLPVRMVLEMDQRHLPKLITECAIRPLQIEVQEVRINAPDILSGSAGGMSSFSGARGGGPAGPEGMVREFGAELQEFEAQPQIVTVAIQGVIYIFNKPNAEALNPSGAATDGSVAVTQ
jgi:hypothetical protein